MQSPGVSLRPRPGRVSPQPFLQNRLLQAIRNVRDSYFIDPVDYLIVREDFFTFVQFEMINKKYYLTIVYPEIVQPLYFWAPSTDEMTGITNTLIAVTHSLIIL